MKSPIEEFDELVANSDILFVVFYRGHWCPFCHSYLKSLQALSPAITSSSSNNKILAITSEPSTFTSQMRQASGYEEQILIDEKNEIVEELRKRKVLDVAISEKKKGYEHGMVQPAVLVLGRNGKVLERWVCVPSAMNMGGAKDRPDLKQIWENVQAKVEGKSPAHQTYATQGAISVLLGKIFGW